MNATQKTLLKLALKSNPYLKSLLKTLLSYGGDVACLWKPNPIPNKSFVKQLLSYAQIKNGRKAKLIKMEANNCHGNSYAMSQKKGMVWMTGYALSSDGVWRPHSWCWDSNKNQNIETTVRRVKYFGVPVHVAGIV